MCKRTQSVRVAQRERVFSFDGSTTVFFLGHQKENGGGIPAGDALHPRPVRGSRETARRVVVPYGRQLLLRCPKFFARIRSQNFDRCHSFLLAFSATGGARKRPPLHKGAFGLRAAAPRKTRGRHAGSAGLMGGFAGKIRFGENFGGFFLLRGAKYPGKALQSQKKYDILAS